MARRVSREFLITVIWLILGVKVSAEVTDDECVEENVKEQQTIILAISIGFCLPALGMYWRSSKLRVPKFRAIVLLIFSIVVRDVVSLAVTLLVSPTDLSCKVWASVRTATETAVYVCLLLEAIFIHRLLTSAFITHQRRRPKMRFYYFGGAVVVIFSTLYWALERYHNWLVKKDANVQLIYNGTRLVIILTDGAVLAHIITVLWKTFRYRPSEQHVTIRTARANIYSTPVFLLHLMLVIISSYYSKSKENIYYSIIYILVGLQGICVALFHFYTDRVVKSTMKAYYRQMAYIFSRSSNFIFDRTVSEYNTNRETWTTTVEEPYLADQAGGGIKADTKPLEVKFYVDTLDHGAQYYGSMLSLPIMDGSQGQPDTPESDKIVEDILDTKTETLLIVGVASKTSVLKDLYICKCCLVCHKILIRSLIEIFPISIACSWHI